MFTVMASRSANVDAPHTATGVQETEGLLDGAVLAAGVFSLPTGAWSSGAAATMAGGGTNMYSSAAVMAGGVTNSFGAAMLAGGVTNT